MCREETGSSLPAELALLRSYLGEIPAPHHRRGLVLTLSVLGLMADCRSLSAIGRWGELREELLNPWDCAAAPQ
jgi:hypothetical protein